MVFATRTSMKGGAVLAYFWIAFVFAVAFAIGGAVGEDFFFWTEVAVVVGAVEEVAFVVGVVECGFSFGSGVGKDGEDVFFEEGFGNGRGFVAGVHDEFFGVEGLEFGKEVEEGTAVVAVAGKALAGENPSVRVTGGLDGVSKDFFVLALVKEAAFGIGGGLGDGGGVGGWGFRWFEVVFSVCISIVGNFFFQLLLVAAHVFFYDDFFVFVAIGMGFDVGGIDELEACVNKALVHGLLKDVCKDGLKEVGVLKTPTVVLPKGGEMGNFIVEVEA